MGKLLGQWLGLLALCIVLASCGGGGAGSTQTQIDPPPPNPQASVPRSGVKNLMIVVMQNASFDHLFGTYPGSTHGLDSSLPSYRQVDQAGNTITPQLMTDLSPDDLHHTATSYEIAFDSGKWTSTPSKMAMNQWGITTIRALEQQTTASNLG